VFVLLGLAAQPRGQLDPLEFAYPDSYGDSCVERGDAFGVAGGDATLLLDFD